jgi:ribosomal protein S18 acetylase RimI-like enzyme
MPAMPVALEMIRPLAAHEIDRLEPLWRALHEHHVRAEPRLAGMAARSADASWRRRRVAYLRWWQDPDTFALVAQTGTEIVGYAFVTVAPGYSVWDSGRKAAQLETLSVAPVMRGLGLGQRLLAAVRERLAGAGIETLVLTVACANDGAQRFYARHGFRPAELLLVGATATDQNHDVGGGRNAAAHRDLRT